MINIKKFSIGMRTVKTGIAIVIALWLSELLNISAPIFSTTAVISTMRLGMTKTVKEAKNTLFTTVFGALIGILFSKLLPHNAVIGGLGVIVVIHILHLLELDGMITLSSMVFMGIFLNYGQEIDYTFSRLSASIVGIMVALIVNYSVFNADALHYSVRSLDRIHSELKEMFFEILKADENKIIIDNSTLFEKRIELGKIISSVSEAKTNDPKKAKIIKLSGYLVSTYSHLSTLYERSFLHKIDECAVKTISCKCFEGEGLPEGVSVNDPVLNYHLNGLLSDLNSYEKMRAELK